MNQIRVSFQDGTFVDVDADHVQVVQTGFAVEVVDAQGVVLNEFPLGSVSGAAIVNPDGSETQLDITPPAPVPVPVPEPPGPPPVVPPVVPPVEPPPPPGPSPEQVALDAAKADLAAAQAKLGQEEMTEASDEAAVAAAQSAVDTAQAALNAASAPPAPNGGTPAPADVANVPQGTGVGATTDSVLPAPPTTDNAI